MHLLVLVLLFTKNVLPCPCRWEPYKINMGWVGLGTVYPLMAGIAICHEANKNTN
jgi:hypothetical protein